ncbi:MAG: ABC transporter substrate-binding protein [Chloroflexi bacterium]|nr:ABC transporter substrate-binding protein [Chloroflexota bacterium]
MGKKLLLETTAPFQGLPELVAYDEGLFEEEGLDVEFIARGQEAPKTTDTSVTSTDLVNPFLSHASSFEGGQAGMYNACEWGNYRRVQDSNVQGRQLGRRAIVVYGALVVAPSSPVYTPQQLANKLIAVPYFAGTHYLALLMLEGFLPRDLIKTCQAPNGSGARYRSLMKGEIDATTLTEPYITVAEKAGCRVMVLAPFHGTEVATHAVDAETYASFSRAVKKAVGRINADKRKYLQYFIDYYKSDPEVAALTVDDLSPGRLQVVEPAPIPEEEMERTRQWMVGWDMIDESSSAESLVDSQRQNLAHELAATSDGDSG